MHFTTLLTITAAAFASTAAAIPRLSGPYHGVRIPIHVPTNATGAHNATRTGTGTRGRVPLSTASAKNATHARAPAHTRPASHGINHVNVNHCHELCSLEAQTCNLAVPDDDAFW
ncbi:hypothetical protein N7499_007888 [Penicillium canescens]|uniref:Uncharacterized protein n=1 Tax=Penicillium canescens TaxID=5083 RepID=A0AAD6HZA4_PENCN|nr:uncharacterized protein N7446_012923 [Penicillium canescens]KAJ5985820.1 hypothetical protein N7522_013016 [Penicillium canescens]KAJ6022573.1 hypothetical protein N7460_012968 [Penicillium canescens]KAJ6026166.1 hypothetical protein N7444_013845 [Penicillium canescens]KAJ6041857.1 hypothetical protein N7446_012923 [Penicillium canescens]KAJ6075907.1 hypothetical protein N7499_007888 [Penicillium canescens]